MCDKQCLLQYSRITYDEEDYYKIDIENEFFLFVRNVNRPVPLLTKACSK